MPLDAICLAAVREELSGSIAGLKIEKVQQPERDIIILALRGAGLQRRLLLSAGTGDARIHLTEYQFENPVSPPMFCMLLRKHLTGARIISVDQPPAERVIELALSAPDALGVLSEKHLIIELIGRASNIILTDNTGIIIDCLRRTGGELEGKRPVLPGLLYRPPPAQEGKLNPLTATVGEWDDLFGHTIERTTDKWLQSVFTALSPLICRELAWRAYGETDFPMNKIRDNGEALKREFFALMDKVNKGDFEPWSITDENSAPRDFSYTMIKQYVDAFVMSREDSFSKLLDNHFSRSALQERIRQRAAAMTKTVRTTRDRLVRKLAVQSEELKKTGEREVLRQCGDIITSNIHLMEMGRNELVAHDFFSETGGTRSIKLDPQKTPQQNAARYYKEYTKAKNAERFLTEQITLSENELMYLESVLEEIKLAEGENDLSSIRSELEQTGYLRSHKKAEKKHKESAPMSFISSTGDRILAGRNNTQNDQLTLKTAQKSDIWLHVQKLHGAHVIITCNGEQPDETSLVEAAVVAAYYSSARGGGKAAVDYTFVRHVKKRPGGRPGMVVYTDYKTIIAAPDEQLVNRLRRS